MKKKTSVLEEESSIRMVADSDSSPQSNRMVLAADSSSLRAADNSLVASEAPNGLSEKISLRR